MAEKTAPELIRIALGDCCPATALLSLVAAKKLSRTTAVKVWNDRSYFNLDEEAEFERDYMKKYDI